jgi:hypothetical protein
MATPSNCVLMTVKREQLIFSRYLEMGGVFERFKNLEFFKYFAINEDLGTITWQDGLDVSPESLYSEATGASLPSWVEP